MSPEFASVLDYEHAVKLSINGVFILAGVAGIVVAVRVRKAVPFLAGLVVLSVGSVAVTGFIFDQWWNALTVAATTAGDQSWLNDHDGGTLVVSVVMLGKGALVFATGFLTCVIWPGLGRDREACAPRK